MIYKGKDYHFYDKEIVLLGLSHYRKIDSFFSFYLYLGAVQNIIYFNFLRFPVSISFRTNIRLLKETEANRTRQNSLYDIEYQYLCEVYGDRKNMGQIQIKPEFNFGTQSNVGLAGITPFANQFMNDVQNADDSYGIMLNSTVYIIQHS